VAAYPARFFAWRPGLVHAMMFEEVEEAGIAPGRATPRNGSNSLGSTSGPKLVAYEDRCRTRLTLVHDSSDWNWTR
jgi:hypothetical protein